MGLVPHTPRGTLSAGTRVGRYELLRRLARGGMAELYLARAVGIHGFEKLCVLKLVLPHLAEDREFAEMFLREARIAAGLDHPNIAHVSDIGEIQGEPFFVMQYIHGRDLRAINKTLDGKAMPLDAALTIATSVASGLHYVHERRGPDGRGLGLVHRDVSPSNVMVGYDGDVKLVDFGIAKSSEQRSATRTGVLKGKVNYMAPEQCHGHPVDRRTDVFALGILLYELSTGSRMFAGDNDFYVMTKIVRGVWANPSEVAEGYPEALEHIVARALQVEPADRYPSAQAMQMDLEAFAQAEGLRISPLSLASFMRETFGEQPLPEAVDPLDVAPTEIRLPSDGTVPFPPDPTSTRMGPDDLGRGHSRVTSMGVGVGSRSLRLLRDDTRIGGAQKHTGLIVGELVGEVAGEVADTNAEGEDDETRAHTKMEAAPANAEGEDETTRISPRSAPHSLPSRPARTSDGPPTATVVLGTASPKVATEATEVLTRQPPPHEHTMITAAPTVELTMVAPVSGELPLGLHPTTGSHALTAGAIGTSGAPLHAMAMVPSGPVPSASRNPIGWIVAAIVAVGLGTLTAAALSSEDTDAPVSPRANEDTPATAMEPTPAATVAPASPTELAPTADPVPDTPQLDPVPQPTSSSVSGAEDTVPVEIVEPPSDTPAVGDDVPGATPGKSAARPRRAKRRSSKADKRRREKQQRLNDSMYPSG